MPGRVRQQRPGWCPGKHRSPAGSLRRGFSFLRAGRQGPRSGQPDQQPIPGEPQVSGKVWDSALFYNLDSHTSGTHESGLALPKEGEANYPYAYTRRDGSSPAAIDGDGD